MVRPDSCLKAAAVPAEKASAVDGTVNFRPDGFALYVDAIPVKGSASDLAPFIEAACRLLCEKFGAADIRCAPKDSPLAFAQWKGALAAVVRDRAKELYGKGWFLLVGSSELRQVAVEALEPFADLVVKGVR